jgi:chemotaxis protein MotB
VARRRPPEDPVNHERWLVSYADFITLLFAFFVVMYAISQVNEEKYRVLSDTLTETFSRAAIVQPPATGVAAPSDGLPLPIELPVARTGSGEGDARSALPPELLRVSERIEQELSTLLDQRLITLRGNQEWLEIELSSSLLFASGSADLNNDALILLGQIAAILRGQGFAVRVEGFTDNVPIGNAPFQSNWALSAARATSVVELFIEEGFAPFQLMAAGYGEFQPIADNHTEEGRARNRRVVLMVARDGRLRPALPVIQAAPAEPSEDQPSAS